LLFLIKPFSYECWDAYLAKFAFSQGIDIYVAGKIKRFDTLVIALYITFRNDKENIGDTQLLELDFRETLEGKTQSFSR